MDDCMMNLQKKTIISLYERLLLIRLTEERIIREYPKKEMRCPVHLCIGEEAVAAGVCGNLAKEDIVFSNHRSHGHYLGKGGNLKSMMAEIYGKETGCSKGRGGSQHMTDLSVNFYGSTPIVGGTIPLAVGSAFASWYLGDKCITAVFFGDGATEEGVFHESLNFAVLKSLPVLFVCENNLYSVYTRIDERRKDSGIHKIIEGYGIPVYTGNGNDAVEVYRIAGKAIEKVRKGKGPAFLEFDTYRLREHCGPNMDAPGVRPAGEIEKWSKKCPVTKLEQYMIKIRIVSDKYIRQKREKIGKEIDEAFAFARESNFAEEGFSDHLIYGK